MLLGRWHRAGPSLALRGKQNPTEEKLRSLECVSDKTINNPLRWFSLVRLAVVGKVFSAYQSKSTLKTEFNTEQHASSILLL